MNGLFICYMLRARGVLNMLEYKPRPSTGGLVENNVCLERSIANCQGTQVWRASMCYEIEVGYQYAVWK